MNSSKFLASITIRPRSSTELTIESILNLCSNFVVFDTGQDVFRFAHLSVREYLESKSEYTWKLANSDAAETCLYTLLVHSQPYRLSKQGGINLPSTHEIPIGKFLHSKFYSYAATFWSSHVKSAGNMRFSHTLQKLLHVFILGDDGYWPTGEFLTWMNYLSSDYKEYVNVKHETSRCIPATPLFVCCICNFQELIPPILDRSTEAFSNSQNIDGRTALEVALFKPANHVLTRLIRGGVHVTQNALAISAASSKSITHLELLLKECPSSYVSAEVITAAISNNSIGEEILLLLVPLLGKYACKQLFQLWRTWSLELASVIQVSHKVYGCLYGIALKTSFPNPVSQTGRGIRGYYPNSISRSYPI